MSHDKHYKLSKIRVLSEIYSRTFSIGAYRMMLEDLEVITDQELDHAIKVYRSNPKNTQFPLSAALVAIIKPEPQEHDIPRQIGNKIWDSISRFGYTNHEQAKAYLGELGWEVVSQMGGWTSICSGASEDQRGIFVAQARDLTESVMRLSKSGKLNVKHELPKPVDLGVQKQIATLAGSIFNKATSDHSL